MDYFDYEGECPNCKKEVRVNIPDDFICSCGKEGYWESDIIDEWYDDEDCEWYYDEGPLYWEWI